MNPIIRSTSQLVHGTLAGALFGVFVGLGLAYYLSDRLPLWLAPPLAAVWGLLVPLTFPESAASLADDLHRDEIRLLKRPKTILGHYSFASVIGATGVAMFGSFAYSFGHPLVALLAVMLTLTTFMALEPTRSGLRERVTWPQRILRVFVGGVSGALAGVVCALIVWQTWFATEPFMVVARAVLAFSVSLGMLASRQFSLGMLLIASVFYRSIRMFMPI